MRKDKLPAAFVAKLKSITAMRARRVIDHILEHRFVTTQELQDLYGYNHPPRGAQDVKDLGVPITMVRVVGKDGRKIAAYSFGDPTKARFGQLKGRSALGKRLKEELLERDGAHCAIYGQELAPAELQIDHRIPYGVAGDVASNEIDSSQFMLLSRSANRAKSWACEHCLNFTKHRKPTICESCYWAHPEDYSHVAMTSQRRLDVLWTGNEVTSYDELRAASIRQGKQPSTIVKEAIARYLGKR
jgi:hypothetical protein